jgi:hypothetical protein
MDLGMMILWDNGIGKHRFRLIRDPEESSPSEVQDLDDDLVLEPPPQVETLTLTGDSTG